MTRAQRTQQRKTIHSWKSGSPFLEQWRKNLKTLTVELKQPRVIDVAPIDFVSGEPVEREGKPTKAFGGQLIYITNADLTIRRPSGAILVIDRYEYEVVAISDGRPASCPSRRTLVFVYAKDNELWQVRSRILQEMSCV